MKKIKRLFTVAVLFAVAAVTMTSCLGSNDDSSIDPQTYASWLSLMSGPYYGDPGSAKNENKLYFYNDTVKDNGTIWYNDSLTDVSANFTSRDSIVAISGVPGRVLAKGIEGDDALKKAIEEAATPVIKAKFVIYAIQTPYAYYSVYPYDVEYPALTYNGQTHKVTVKLLGSTNGIFFNTTKNVTSFNLYAGAVYIDGNLYKTIWDGTTSSSDYAKKSRNAALAIFLSK